MQAAALNFRTCGMATVAPRASTRRTVTVSAVQGSDIAKEMAKNAALMAAVVVLTLVPSSDANAAIKKTTKFQKELAYQQEMIDAIKARSGKEMPALKDSPKVGAVEIKDRPALKLDGVIEKVKVEPPSSVPTPNPALPTTATAPTAAAASEAAQ